MEAPEKIYCHRNEFGYLAYSDQPFNYAEEYTRTDAFIEKTISWLKDQDEIIGVSFQEDFLERFKNYMKGE